MIIVKSATATVLKKIGVSVLLFILSFTGFGQKLDDSKVVANKQNDVLYANTAKNNDAVFLVDVAEINQIEIKLGGLAQKISTNGNVKKLGKMIETLHRTCMDELIELSKKESISLPKSLTDNGIAVYEKFSNLSGSFFVKNTAI